jgi:long-chain acyl-CoA synthetase
MKVLDDIRQHARLRPAHPALVVERRAGDAEVVGYAELAAAFTRLAAGLRAGGVGARERVGLRARQGRPFVEAALAILDAQACLVPIPEDTRGPALAQAARDAALAHLLEALPEPRLERCEGARSVDGQGDEIFRSLRPAYLRFTSGTTSARKGVIVGEEAIAARLDNANRALGIGPDDRILWQLPMAHHFLVSILLYLRAGATVLLPQSPFAGGVLAFASAWRASVLYASPFHHNLLAKDRGGLGLPDVRLAISTTDGLREEVARRFDERFGIPLVQALGIIEVGLPVLNLASARSKPTALGRATPGYEVWLRGDDGARLPQSSPRRTGEICIRGSGLFDAYLSPFVLARDVLVDGAFATGDQGWFDAEGDLVLCGRRSNRINLAGMKFFSEEVEAALDRHPAVRMSRVSPRAHPHLGEVPVAEIVLAPGAEAPAREALVAFLREQLADYKIPREFRVTASLERTATGKLQRWTDGSPLPAAER